MFLVWFIYGIFHIIATIIIKKKEIKKDFEINHDFISFYQNNKLSIVFLKNFFLNKNSLLFGISSVISGILGFILFVLNFSFIQSLNIFEFFANNFPKIENNQINKQILSFLFFIFITSFVNLVIFIVIIAYFAFYKFLQKLLHKEIKKQKSMLQPTVLEILIYIAKSVAKSLFYFGIFFAFYWFCLSLNSGFEWIFALVLLLIFIIGLAILLFRKVGTFKKNKFQDDNDIEYFENNLLQSVQEEFVCVFNYAFSKNKKEFLKNKKEISKQWKHFKIIYQTKFSSSGFVLFGFKIKQFLNYFKNIENLFSKSDF
ncbi:hypothetical protein [Mycoplasma procyoni]|uniref:hypothetical protein n=1 Tax=Mycoplasma procyoni TaxID=568784 RepID=UPI00197BD2FB|nr:hypothetical protein [Mycoplasma procyoni]MBN3534515.1 hypothetical protein [Mycoplasma procyoni]